MTVIAEPIVRRWSRDEYYRLAEEGWFHGQRVQLIEGEIIQIPPQGALHANGYWSSLRTLTGIFGIERVRAQMPFNVRGRSDPEPDLAVTDLPQGQCEEPPSTAVLVIEISDSSIRLDRRKTGLYAAAGVPDYWIVNVNARRVEIFRNPITDPNNEFGHRYTEHFEVDETANIAPLASPNSNVAIKSLF
jgi:Uma2 family endonuclease